MSNRSNPFLFTVFIFMALVMVYSPVLYFSYVFHDDATYWARIKDHPLYHCYISVCMNEGRWGNALLVGLQNLFLHSVSGLGFLRFLAMSISSATAWILWMQMRRLSISNIQAFFIIAGVLFLPGFADLFFNASYGSMIAICLLLSCWSFDQIQQGKNWVLPFLAFVFAITIYPSGAMFYWTMAGLYVLFFPDKASPVFKDTIWRVMRTGLTGLLVYAACLFLMQHFQGDRMIGSGYDPYHVSFDLRGKLQWFFHEPLVNALNLWDIFPKASTALAVSGIIAFTVLNNRRWFFILIFISFLTFLPNLAAQGNAAFYRCLLPLTSLIWLMVVWAVSRWRLSSLLPAIVLWAGVTTFNNVLYRQVLPNHMEWRAYQSMARQVIDKKINAVHIILPGYHPSRERYDEFGVLSSQFISNLYPLVVCALDDTQPNYPAPLVYYSSSEGQKMVEIIPMIINNELVYGNSDQPPSFKLHKGYVLNLTS